jgi:hypothetical protein
MNTFRERRGVLVKPKNSMIVPELLVL